MPYTTQLSEHIVGYSKVTIVTYSRLCSDLTCQGGEPDMGHFGSFPVYRHPSKWDNFRVGRNTGVGGFKALIGIESCGLDTTGSDNETVRRTGEHK